MKTTKSRRENLLSPFQHRSKLISLILVLIIQLTLIIVIPIVYSVGRNSSQSSSSTINTTIIGKEFIWNECTQTTDRIDPLYYLINEEPFPYRTIELIYRPRVVTKSIEIFFGFRHDQKSWSLDQIEFIEQNEDKINRFRDGDFESNYLYNQKNYRQCILSNSRSSTSEILFDLPFQGDFYYNDQTTVGMNYLSQTIDVTGGKYYRLKFVLENRGYQNNLFVVLIKY